MKLKLIATKENKELIKTAINKNEIEYSDDAPFVLYELHHEHNVLLVKDQEEYFRISVNDIIYIEASNNIVYVHTKEGRYQIKETMYQLEASLYEKGFLRIHKAFIVNKKDIRRIKTSLNMKFVLLLSNEEQIEVSRSYYYHFKEEMGF
ncbi:LytR/AlgR family response regulator transcription factor [[Eubacterium] hominis]|uniref:LytR/AlgR family response regulator transcription factor n=1 Tax=[Eubacterium] hominis TaxID=2764325 RepID=UPI003A4D7934